MRTNIFSRDEITGQFLSQRSRYHPDDLILDEPDRLDEEELVFFTGHQRADLREWDQ